jgi:prepilin-type N-terminal cleavage/methylation domain-containing protein
MRVSSPPSNRLRPMRIPPRNAFGPAAYIFRNPSVMPQLSPPPRPTSRRSGFTLVELLVVVSVIVLITTLAVPAFNAIRGGTDFASEVYTISDTLQEARAYAMSYNTFVLVGFMETNAAISSSVSPQASGLGRVAMAVIASKDGTRPYQTLLNTPALTGTAWELSTSPNYGSGAAFVPVSKLMTFPNLHLLDLQPANGQRAVPTTISGMLRPAVLPANDISNQSGACISATPFAWPIGSGFNSSPPPQYGFTQVIEFDPQGSARIISGAAGALTTNQDAIPHYIEIGLQPSNGPVLNAAPLTELNGQMAAVQIDGMSGATRIYRP